MKSAAVTLLACVVCACVLSGCASQRRRDNVQTVGTSDGRSELQRHLAERGSITFRSWNGQWIGTDCDTDLTLFRDGSLHMFEYGYALMAYEGRWHLEDDQRVTASINEFPSRWPAMITVVDRGALTLRPADSNNGFMMGSRGGATLRGGSGTYFPFRAITGEEESQVLRRIDTMKRQTLQPPSAQTQN